MDKQKYPALDIMKWVCAWMVVVIHAAPLRPYSRIADLYTAHGICRMAVPLFFAGSAFLLLRKLDGDPARGRRTALRYCLRIFAMYAVWSVIYFLVRIPTWVDMGRWGPALLTKQVRLFFFEASFYHLWYLLATVYAVPLVCLLHKADRRIILAVIAPLWCLHCLQYTYSWTGLFPSCFSWLQENWGAVLNALLCAVPLMGVGSLALTGHRKHGPGHWLRRTAVWTVLFFAELTAAYLLSPDRVDYPFFLSAPVLAYYLLCWLLTLELSVPNRVCAALRHQSTWIYCFHPLPMLIYDHHSQVVGLKRFAVVAAACLLTGILYTAIKLRRHPQPISTP